MTKTTKHTPGPWHQGGEDFGSENHFIVSGGEYLQLATVHARTTKEETEANARLIAAAPELLEACKAIMQAITQKEEDAAFRLIEQAIAKAENNQ